MIENAVRVLNELLEADPEATNKFFLHLGVEVNKQVCDHPTIQVLGDRTKLDSAQTGDNGILRPLGLLNGLFQGNRVIVMEVFIPLGAPANETEIAGFAIGVLEDGKVRALPKMDRPLAEELAMFEAHRQEWLTEHEGQFALVKNGEFSFHKTDNDAFECGIEKYGDVDMLIKQVLLEDLFEGSHALRFGGPPARVPGCE